MTIAELKKYLNDYTGDESKPVTVVIDKMPKKAQKTKQLSGISIEEQLDDVVITLIDWDFDALAAIKEKMGD